MTSLRRLRGWLRERNERFAADANPELAAENQQIAEWLTEALRAEAESITADQVPQFRVPSQTRRPGKVFRSRPVSRSSRPPLEATHEDP